MKIQSFHQLTKSRLSPLSLVVLSLWLLAVCGAIIISGCSEDRSFDPTLSSTASVEDAASAGPISDFRFDPGQAIEVSLDEFLGGDGSVEAGDDVVGRIKHKTKSKKVKAGKELKMNLKPLKLKGGKPTVASEMTIHGESWVKTTGHGNAEVTDWIQFELTPAVQFLQSVTVEVKRKDVADLVDGEGQFLLWMLDAKGNWQELDTGADDGKKVTFEIDGGGRYAMIRTDANSAKVLDEDFAAPDEYEIIHWSEVKDCEVGKDEKLNLGDEMHLLINEGSLSHDATISADIWIKFLGHGSHATVDWIVIELEPEMVFIEPVNLQIEEKLVENNAGDDGDYILWYLNEMLNMWEYADDGTIVQVSVPRNPVHTIIKDFVQFDIEHFSKYAIGR